MTSSYETVTCIINLIHTAHEVASTPVTYRPLSDPVFVTFRAPACAARQDGKSQAGFILAMAECVILNRAGSPTHHADGVDGRYPVQEDQGGSGGHHCLFGGKMKVKLVMCMEIYMNEKK